ncbi:MAG: peroxide stress protein YaaA, partial [Mariniphaga sp.]
MLTIIAPAKTLDFESKPVTEEYTLPGLLDESEKLVEKLRKMKPDKLSQLMNVSPALADLNYHRYQMWQRPFSPDNAKQAVLAFNGDV